jgi:plastocyanin
MTMTSNRYLPALVLAGLVAVLGAAGCSSGSSGSMPMAPSSGGTTAGPLHLGPFAIGQSAEFTFTTAGSFGYHCIAHRNMGMVGTVQVDGSGVDSLVVLIAPASFSFAPPTAHIKPGGYVRWVNASSLTNHTVTSD